MSEIVKFKLKSGGEVLVEAMGDPASEQARVAQVLEDESFDEPLPAALSAKRAASKAVREASKTFEEALETVKPIAQAVVEAFQGFNQPTEIGLEFGIELQGGVDAFLVAGEGRGTFKLSLKWSSEGVESSE